MNHFKKHFFIATFLLGTFNVHLFAASVTLSAPDKAVANGQPLTVQLFLDQEQDTISGISGQFSFPTELFTVGDISTKNSVVPLWISQPAVSEDKYFNRRTYITFEGIFPGGYNGVRSPYYSGAKPGILLSVTLYPKNEGKGTLLVDNLILNSFSADAKPLPVTPVNKLITVPMLHYTSQTEKEVEVFRPSLSALITRDPLVQNNAWYLLVEDREGGSAIKSVFVAETYDADVRKVRDSLWQQVEIPHVLTYQTRSKYVHIKVLYANNTFSYTSLPPVENSRHFEAISRILLLMGLAAFLLYKYGAHFFTSRKKLF